MVFHRPTARKCSFCKTGDHVPYHQYLKRYRHISSQDIQYIWLSSGLKEKIKCRDPVCKHNLPLHCSIRQTTGLEVRKGTLVVLKGQTCCRVIVIEACKLTFFKFLRFLDCCWTVFLIGSFNRFLIISSTNYFSSGINKWRDSRTPKQILEKYCEVNNFFKPRYLGNNNVIFHGDEFYLDDFGKLISTVTSVFFLSFFLVELQMSAQLNAPEFFPVFQGRAQPSTVPVSLKTKTQS